jgi:hypothetical protein
MAGAVPHALAGADTPMMILTLGLIVALLVVCAGALVTLVRRFAEMDYDNAKKMQAVHEAIDTLRTPLEALVALETTKQEQRRDGRDLIRERLKARAVQQAAKSAS